MKFPDWWQQVGRHLPSNDFDLAEAAFDAGADSRERHTQALRACVSTAEEIKTLCNDSPVNDCKTEIVLADVRKTNKHMDEIHEKALQLLDLATTTLRT